MNLLIKIQEIIIQKKKKIEKELELNKKDCKEMNKSINVLLIDIKTIKSAIFDYNVKISKIRKELNKNLTKGNNLNKEVEYLIKHYSKKK